MDLSIVIPVYNGEKTLNPLFSEIQTALAGRFSFEVIFVYDCGPDNSWEIISELKRTHPRIVKAVKLSRNYGQHNALICGFQYADGNFIVTMDEDLQHAPADIPRLIDKQKEKDFSVVYGRYATLKHSLFRNTTSLILKRLLRLGIPGLHPDYTAFRLIKSGVAKQTINMRNSYTFLDGYLTWVTTHVSSCTVTHRERLAGESSYNLLKLIEHTINIFVTFSNLPMRLLIIFSVLVFLSTSFYSLYLIVRKFYHHDLVPGYASLMILAGLGIGLILLGMGILGEYIHRINMKTTRRPDYIVQEILE